MILAQRVVLANADPTRTQNASKKYALRIPSQTKTVRIARPRPIRPRPSVSRPPRPMRIPREEVSTMVFTPPLERTQEIDFEEGGVLSELGRRWERLPARYRLVVATSLAFVICNMDKVNMSVAIIPMAQEFGWKASMAGLVQSSFFWGYLLFQAPGGYLCSRLGGRTVMPSGVGLWSLATASLPLLAGTVPGLVLSRSLVGMGEAVAPSAATDMVARAVPVEERSRAISFIFGGLHVGSVMGLLLAPYIIDRFGWPSVFLVFGGAGLLWVAWFEKLLHSTAKSDPKMAEVLTRPQHLSKQPVTNRKSAMSGQSGGALAIQSGVVNQQEEEELPWRAMLRSSPVRALAFAHFCNNWFSYTMMAWLPSYFTDTLRLDLAHAAQVSLLPPMAGLVVSGIAGSSADFLVSKGWKTATVRKLAQCTAFLGPFLCLAGASQHQDDMFMNVGLVTLALGLASFSLGGLYCNHQDLSQKYSSFLLGLTNTVAAVPGIAGVLLTGMILDQTGDWPTALFAPAMFFFLAGSVVYGIYGRAEPLSFDDNAPFDIEVNFFSKWLPKTSGDKEE
ncbi:hypothetical protein BSKO_13518 [Bryopsis sp. KO-2023]|nr:hypothetical protein BSKO_13518 [Bryopsis sp. KO-2023]